MGKIFNSKDPRGAVIGNMYTSSSKLLSGELIAVDTSINNLFLLQDKYGTRAWVHQIEEVSENDMFFETLLKNVPLGVKFSIDMTNYGIYFVIKVSEHDYIPLRLLDINNIYPDISVSEADIQHIKEVFAKIINRKKGNDITFYERL